MADNHLNALQLSQVNLRAGELVGKYMEQLQLRKWAVEQAFKVVGTPDELTKLAAAIYDFVAPAPVKVEIDPNRPF